ncbi:MAG: hypothetical protein C0518_05950 [Opitutus sp.]|nr:hypothetical protein [Opitutus sp.]
MRVSLCLLFLPLAAGAADTPPVRAEFVAPDRPELAALVRAGEAATAEVATKLLAELTVAMSDGRPEAAVEVCHLKALPVTAEKNALLPEVLAVKRTSDRVRNPVNAPDAAEQRALAHAATLLAAGKTLPPLLVQRIESGASGSLEWRVYRPVFVQPACLACHGEPAAQSAELRAALQQRYPADAALHYRAGDWRGFIRATVAFSPGQSNRPQRRP